MQTQGFSLDRSRRMEFWGPGLAWMTETCCQQRDRCWRVGEPGDQAQWLWIRLYHAGLVQTVTDQEQGVCFLAGGGRQE